MPSEPVIDFDALLTPISDDRPAGVYVREDPDESGVYYDIKSFRDDARTAEEYVPSSSEDGIDEQPPNPVELWGRLLNRCVSVLENKTKDLEFAAYLTEALLRVKQAAGLRDGLRLMREYVERYWDRGLNPPPDMDEPTPEAQMGRRLSPISNLNTGTLTTAIDGLYLNDPDLGGIAPTFFDYHTAHAAAYPKKGSPNFEKMQELKKRIDVGPADYVCRLHDDLVAAGEELEKLNQALVATVGSREAPSVGKIREKIEANLRHLKDIAGHRLTGVAVPAPAGAPSPPAAPAGAPVSVAGVSFVPGPVAGREDALRTLLEIATFFKNTEPHSPVSYHVEEAVRWGRMSLSELLRELIPNSESRGSVMLRIGIQEESSPSSE